MDPAPTASVYRLVVEVEALSHLEADNGWTVHATTGRPAVGVDADILQAYQDHNTPVDPGVRWRTPPAALSPVWLETPAWMAALARPTGRGVRVDTVRQRYVRRALRLHDQPLPGHTGETATPTAAVVWSLLPLVAVVP